MRERVEERISFGDIPDRQGQLSTRLEHSQHLANAVNRRRKEHRAEAADHGIEAAGRERQIVCKRDLELRIPEAAILCRPASRCHHSCNRIDPHDLAFGSDQGSYAQGRLSRTRSNIQNRVLTANLPILDKSLCDRRKHLPDEFAVLLPERSGTAPSV